MMDSRPLVLRCWDRCELKSAVSLIASITGRMYNMPATTRVRIAARHTRTGPLRQSERFANLDPKPIKQMSAQIYRDREKLSKTLIDTKPIIKRQSVVIARDLRSYLTIPNIARVIAIRKIAAWFPGLSPWSVNVTNERKSTSDEK
jgi:hypothetical protein